MSIKKVMIVDDSESDQFLSKMQIEAYNSSVEISQAYDGQEALETLGDMAVQPDIIFLDINMPRMDGLEFLEHYSKFENQVTVITMLTSSDQEKDKEVSLSYSYVKSYFVKPLDGLDLEMLETLC